MEQSLKKKTKKEIQSVQGSKDKLAVHECDYHYYYIISRLVIPKM